MFHDFHTNIFCYLGAMLVSRDKEGKAIRARAAIAWMKWRTGLLIKTKSIPLKNEEYLVHV